jgi:hypothetical protein
MAIERPQDELSARPIVIIGIVGCVAIFAFIVALTAVFTWYEEQELGLKNAGQAPSELRLSESEQQAILTQYAWVDQEKGIVRIPVERAMELMLTEARKEGD